MLNGRAFLSNFNGRYHDLLVGFKVATRSINLEKLTVILMLTTIFFTMGISGCARMHRAELATRAQTELVGMSKKELYVCAGVPARQERVDDLEFLTYIGGGDGTGVAVGTAVSNVGVGAVSTQHRYCEVTFVLSNGIVQKVNYQGRTGGWASKGEQCAFVVENCLRK